MSKYRDAVKVLNTDAPDTKVEANFHYAVEATSDKEGHKFDVNDAWTAVFTTLRGRSEGGQLRKSAFHSIPTPLNHLRDGAINFLQKQFSNVIQKALHRSAPPDDVRTIRDYIRVTHGPGVQDDVYAILYYAFRSGGIERARHVAQSLPSMAQWARTYLAYPAAQLPPLLLQDIIQRFKNAEAHRRIFEFLVYGLIGHFSFPETFDTIRRGPPELQWTAQDFLWFRLRTLTEDLSAPATDQNSLKSLQETLRELGPSHFNANGDRRLFYFQLLLLSLQFERAVTYLLESDPHGNPSPFFVEGVHIALVFHYYGVLREPQFSNNILDEEVFVDTEQPTFNTAAALKHYVADLLAMPRSSSAPGLSTDALLYYALITDLTVVELAFKDLLLMADKQTFKMLLGIGIGPEQPGRPQVATIESILQSRGGGDIDAKAVLRQITIGAADICKKRGRHEDAAELYRFAEDYESLLDVLNSQLEPHRLLTMTEQRLFDLASFYYERPPAVSFRGGDVLRTFRQLFPLARFFNHYRLAMHDEALADLGQVNLLPSNRSEVDQRVADFKLLDEKVKKLVGETLLTSMTILFNKYQTSDRDGQAFLREMAEGLVSYASKIKYKLPAETSTRLLHMLLGMGGSIYE